MSVCVCVSVDVYFSFHSQLCRIKWTSSVSRYFSILPPVRKDDSIIDVYLFLSLCVCVLIAQSCLTLCDPLDCSPPGSSVHGILQTRLLERNSPGDLPDPGIEPKFLAFQASSLPSEPPGKPTLIPKTIHRGIKATTSSWWHLTAGVADGNDCGHSILSPRHCAISVGSLCLTDPRAPCGQGPFSSSSPNPQCTAYGSHP